MCERWKRLNKAAASNDEWGREACPPGSAVFTDTLPSDPRLSTAHVFGSASMSRSRPPPQQCANKRLRHLRQFAAPRRDDAWYRQRIAQMLVEIPAIVLVLATPLSAFDTTKLNRDMAEWLLLTAYIYAHTVAVLRTL